jgi:hypothetical protein
MEARGTRSIAFKAAILVIVLVATATFSPRASGRRALTISRAEAVARDAVLAHRSYRQITSARTGLVTRSCRRAAEGTSKGIPKGRVRCSLYVVAPNPCALEASPGGVCVQALWERRWLVEVRRGRHRPAARILEISSGPSASRAQNGRSARG